MKLSKTTMTGLLLVILTACKLSFPEIITPEVFGAVSTLLAAVGLKLAQDQPKAQ